jgi:hypothetical protein
MADVAHGTSGPASPKPGDITPQQASRPDSPDKGKLRIFISYSRDVFSPEPMIVFESKTIGHESPALG